MVLAVVDSVWGLHDKVPSRVAYLWEKNDAGPLGCPTTGENLVLWPLGALSVDNT